MRNSLLFFFFLFSSCGYHLGRNDNSEIKSVEVPYVEEDMYGLLTNELIKNIANSSAMHYQSTNANYELKVKVLNSATNKIGYKYDTNNEGQRTKNIRPTEGRCSLTAEVQLINIKTREIKFGPFTVTSDSDFDYVDQDSLSDLSFIDPSGNRITVLSFSLGQLESIDSAKEAALKPLFEQLAKKIVDAISTYW
ncbi:MAG: LPS assembly lipoprotein LptE [Parachlamydiales bacterium]|jgi:hypothetical protein